MGCVFTLEMGIIVNLFVFLRIFYLFSNVLMSCIALAVVRDAMLGGCLPDDICVISSAKAMYSVSCVGGGMSCV